MLPIAFEEYADLVKKFMTEKGWRVCICSSCGKYYFFKPSTKLDVSVCGWDKCNKGINQFLSFPKRKKMLSPRQICSMIENPFSSFGFEIVAPLNIANIEGQTDLIIAGVQVFDGVIHRSQPFRDNSLFIAQPSVRMQFQDLVQYQEGVSTAFVNVCTEKMGISFADHLQIVDEWFTILSRLGLHMNDFVVVMRITNNDWGTGEFPSLEIFLSYGGLELGDAAYMNVPRLDKSSVIISDIGFGLERISWAINKTNSYFDLLAPFAKDCPRTILDSCRTLALLALCGVQPENKGPGLQFRRFSKVLSENYDVVDIYYFLEYYFDYWAQFIKPSITRESALHLIRLEIDRFVNVKISEKLKMPPPHFETTDAYFNRLVYTYGVSIDELRRAFKTFKE